MSNPNPNVWGAPSAWVNAEIFPAVGSGDSTIKAVKPKCTQFQAASPWYSRMSLGRGVQMGKITANQPIDNSICTNGQHPIISPFAHIGLFKNKQSSTSNIIPDSVYEETNQINWFFADVNAGSGGLRDHTIDTTQANQRWAPNSDSSNNMNYWTSPFVYYQIKSILLLIKVDVITGYNAKGFPTMQTYSLREWKTSHSDKKVAQIWLQFYGYNQLSGNNLSYTTDDTTSQVDQCTTVCIMNSVNNIIDYATYNVNRSCKFYIVHALYDNGYDTTTTYYATAYKMFENQTYHSAYYQNTEGGWNLWSEIPYSDKNYETILKMAALFGCPFTDTSTTTFDVNFLSNDLFLPVIPEDGIALGEYTHGVRNVLNSLYDADSVRDLNYNPDTPLTPIDTNTYSNTTDFRTVQLVSGTNQYVVDVIGVNALMTKLYDIFAGWSDVTYAEVMGKVTADFLVSEPLQSIVSLYAFPFTPPHPDTTTTVKLGNNDTGIQAYKLTKMTEILTFTGINTIFPRFGDCFLDYEPYTRYEVYVPFCGTVKLNAADILGHKLNVKMSVDLVTGVCTGYILADNLCIETVTGTCGVQLPISGLDTATINANIVSANIRQKSADSAAMSTMLSTLTPSGLGAAVSNPFSFADKLQQSELALQQANYDVSHIPANPHSIGSASPLTGWCSDLSARLIIYYPTGDAIDSGNPPDTLPTLKDLTTYGHTTGFATLDINALSNYSGFTQVSNIDLTGITATESELNEIRTLLQSGVYV